MTTLYLQKIETFVRDFVEQQQVIMDDEFNQWIEELKNGFEKVPKAVEFLEGINSRKSIQEVSQLLTRY